MDEMNRDPEKLRAEILSLSREYSRLVHKGMRPADDPLRPAFDPSVDGVPYGGRVFDEEEVSAAVGSVLDFWLTLGKEGEAFEAELASALGVRSSLLVNSGSSANLVALAALTTHKLPAERRLLPGDEVITVAAGFPTTVAPIMQCGAVPVFIDNDPVTGNLRVDQLEEAYRSGKTKAVMMAHTLGNPFDLRAVLDFCRRHELWLVEDNCDSLGSAYEMPESELGRLGLEHLKASVSNGRVRALTGSWGDLSTQSFYPPHHITMGEGGAVNIVRRASLRSYAESFRDWGRDCWCPSGHDNTCGKRFQWQLGELPEGYDHKYVYSHLGYNLKPLDLQAAIGRRQLPRLPSFVAARRRNWEHLRSGLADLEDYFSFTLPTHAKAWNGSGFDWDESGCRCEPSWFGFMLRVRPCAPFTHSDLARHLDSRKIGNRMLFGGNLVRQPAFVRLRRERPDAFRVAGSLAGADAIMREALFLGVYPGIGDSMADHVISCVRDFVRQRHGGSGA
jgi:CDP-6-deoxy-D-xylo-4-hexulose-3-dehydrase